MSSPKPSSIPRPQTTPTKTTSFMTPYGYKSPTPSPRRTVSESTKPHASYARDELRQLKAESERKECILAELNGEKSSTRVAISKLELQHQTYDDALNEKQKQIKILANRLESLQNEITSSRDEAHRNFELKEKQMKLDNDSSMYEIEKSYRSEIERQLADKVGKIQEKKANLTNRVALLKEELQNGDSALQDSLAKLTLSMKRKEEELRSYMAKERQQLEEEYKMMDIQIQDVQSQVAAKKSNRENLKEDEHKKVIKLGKSGYLHRESTKKLSQLQDEHKTLEEHIKSTQNKITSMKMDIENKKVAKRSYDEALLLEEDKRRNAHNRLQELKGNIRVFCRIRPRLDSEIQEPELRVQVPDNDEVKQEIEIEDSKGRPSSANGSKKHNFKFDKVFQQRSKNPEIFEEISQLVQSALYGFNVCIFAYGQTGSGKTHTMSNEDGVIPQTITQIFETCHKLEKRGFTFKVFGEFLQIYNESIMDLVNGGSEDKKFEIKHDQERKSTYITNMTRLQFTSPQQMNKALQRALDNRSVAATKSNERSSRSHTVCIITLEVHNDAGEEYTSVLNLIDLAGSERIAQSQVCGDRLKETQAINKSLSALGDVICALGDSNAKHIPFRNSKLTYLLQYSLIEDSKTLMFVNVSPLQKNLNETINSLRFATKVNNTGLQRKV